MNLPDVEGMLASDVWEVRAQAAQCSDLTLVQIEKLLDDSDDRVRNVAADLHRDIPMATIERVLQLHPEDAANFAYNATAPGEALGYKMVGFATNDELSRYAAHRNASPRDAARLIAAGQDSKTELITLNQLWERVTQAR